MEECHQSNWKDRNEFICVYCTYNKNFKMRFNGYRKKAYEKAVDDDGNHELTLKLYLPLRNKVKGIILANGGNALEYKVEALSKPRCNHLIVSKLVPPIQQKRKKENNHPLDNYNNNVGQVMGHGLAHKKMPYKT